MTQNSDEVVMIDTSVWISSFRGKPEDITEITRQLLVDDRALTCSPIMFEIRRGLLKSERSRVLTLMRSITHLPITERDWDTAGDLDALLRGGGITIPPMDLLIAQVCLSYEIPLFTLDRHFESINNLKLFMI